MLTKFILLQIKVKPEVYQSTVEIYLLMEVNEIRGHNSGNDGTSKVGFHFSVNRLRHFKFAVQ